MQNGPAYGSEPLSSPAPVGQINAGTWKVVVGKNVCEFLGPLHFSKLAKTTSFRRSERANGKRPKKFERENGTWRELLVECRESAV